MSSTSTILGLLVFAQLLAVSIACIGSGVCGGGGGCYSPPPVSCGGGCSPGYSCGHFGCARRKARAHGINTLSGDQNVVGFQQRLIPRDPNQMFTQCCEDRNLPDSCLSLCNFNAYTKEALMAMYFRTSECPISAAAEMQFCAAQGRDHTPCCARNGVANTLSGSKCLIFCDQRPGNVSQLDFSYASCYDRFEQMKEEYLSSKTVWKVVIMLISQKLDAATTQSEAQTQHSSILWHPNRDLLAVSSFSPVSGGYVSFVSKKGGKSFYSNSARSDQHVNSVEWHPTETILAIGWESGAVSLVDPLNSKGLFHPKRASYWSLQNAMFLEEMDNGGPDDGLEFTGLQKDIDGAVSFIIATSNSALYVVRPDEEPHQIYTSDSPMKQVLKMSGQYVVAISENLMFYQLMIEGNSVDDKIKVKLSGKPEYFQVIQIDNDIVAICYGEREIRIWDLQKEDSAVFRLTQERGYNGNEQICSLSHSTKKDSISGATLDGKIATWKRHRESYDLPIDQQWRLQSSMSIGGKMSAMAWSNTSPTLAVCSIDSIQIFRSQSVATCVDVKYAMLQLGPQQVSLIKIVEPIESQDVRFEHVISGFHLHGRHFVTWNEEQLYVHEIIDQEDSPLDVQQLSVVSAPLVSNALIYGQQLYSVEKGQLNVRTFQGTLKKTISFREIEGDVDTIDLNGRWLVLGSTHGYLRVYELNDGLTVLKRNDEIDERFYIWDAESDTLSFFSFAVGLTDQQQYEAQLEKQRTVTAAGRLKTAGGLRPLTTPPERPKTAAARRIERDQNRFRLPFHLPGEHRWDTTDGRFVCCEANHVNADGSADFLLTMFATADNGLQIHDLQPKPVKADRFVWLSVPFVYFHKNAEVDEADDVTVERSISRLLLRRTLREFVGIAADDRQAVEAMIDFAFFLCIEQMDKAFTAIKFIKNEQVWESMARIRIHLRNTHYNFAKYLESIREVEQAIDNYEKSQTHHFEVPRMLADEPKAVDLYVKRKRDRELYRWWARYLESVGDLDGARNYYKYADDFLAVIRILCYDGRIEEATEVVNRTDDRAAAFHLARYFEANSDFEQAVHFFTKASSYNTAIRLAREHEMSDKLASLALLAGGNELIETARYYEDLPGYADKAVLLYHKAGMIGRALDLAFRTEQFSALDLIARDLNEDSDPQVLQRAAQFFSTPDRKALLEEIARCCLQQANYYFAAKKFTQAGNKTEVVHVGWLEIDDYHDYEKAITAYNEAIRCWNKKSEKDGDLDNKVSNKRDRLKSTVNRIKEFIGIKELYNGDPGAAMTQMNAMANDQKDGVIRLGDIYSFLINHNAYQFIQEYQSKKPTVDISEYISEPILDQICDEANVPRITRAQLKEQNSYDEEDAVEFSHALKRRMSQYSDDDSVAIN
ncbi:Intraflagellar transport protein [Aphelenchoides besseyi]|nr:Intraflagellar transport protein [Aphelenchoides besseyi]